MPIFSEIEEGRADKKYNSPEIDDIYNIFDPIIIIRVKYNLLDSNIIY
jgi:hypothetical protein